MFIRLKKGFETIEQGVQVGYFDPAKRRIIQVARIFPGKPEKVTDEEGVLILEQYKCLEETKDGAPYKTTKPGVSETAEEFAKEIAEHIEEGAKEEPQPEKKAHGKNKGKLVK